MGLVDGFNPCAMWVLIFLVGLLLGTHEGFAELELGIHLPRWLPFGWPANSASGPTG